MKMKRENVLKRLQALKNSLSEVGVTRLGLFGSTARGENTSRSDIDILLDFGAGRETYVNFLAACHCFSLAYDGDTFWYGSPHIVNRLS